MSATKRPVKGYTLQARITGPMRDALKAEADATGRSISQVACLWLELARRLPNPDPTPTKLDPTEPNTVADGRR